MKALDREMSLKDRIRLLMKAYAEMVNRLAATIAIGRDRALRDHLRTLAAATPCDSFLVCQLRGRAWLKIEGESVSLHREREDGLSTVNLDDALGSNRHCGGIGANLGRNEGC